jgi:hypothetical protein
MAAPAVARQPQGAGGRLWPATGISPRGIRNTANLPGQPAYRLLRLASSSRLQSAVSVSWPVAYAVVGLVDRHPQRRTSLEKGVARQGRQPVRHANNRHGGQWQPCCAQRGAVRSPEANDLGIKLEKTWLPTLDNRTRPDHAETTDYGALPLDEKFVVGGYERDRPGDPAGPPSETINCQRTLAMAAYQIVSGFQLT